jgi:hypothetical protein
MTAVQADTFAQQAVAAATVVAAAAHARSCNSKLQSQTGGCDEDKTASTYKAGWWL